MALKTSLLITGDASIAKKAVEDVAAAVAKLGTGAKGAAAPVQQLDQALDAATTTTRDMSSATKAAETAQTAAAQANMATATAARELAQSLGQAAAAQANVTGIMQQSAAAQSAQLAVIQAIVSEGRQLASVFGILSAAGTASAAAIDMVGTAALKASAANDVLENETRQTANAQTALDAATRRVLQAVDEEALGLLKLNDLLEDAKLALDAGRISQEQFARVQALGSKASDSNARSLGQQKVGMFSLGQQMQDVGIQLSMGTDIMRVMAMQGGQLATAVDMIGVKGAGGRVAAFFAGPWGAIVLTATAILGPMVAKLWETSDAADKATKSELALVDALGKKKFATDAGREAIKAYNEAQDQSRKSNDLNIQRSLAEAEADLKLAAATREKTKAKLEDMRARALDPGAAAITGSAGVGGNLLNNINLAAVEASLKTQTAAIAQIEQARRELLIKVGTKAGEAAADPLKAIDLQYDLERQAAERAAASNTKLAREIRETVKGIETRRAAARAEEQERQSRENKKPRAVSLGNQIEAGSAASMLASAERYRGLSENRAGDRDQLKELFKQANVNVDPKMTAWCAAFVNAVLASNGIQGTVTKTGAADLSARSFLAYGQNTDSPNKGDIVVSKRGNNAAQGHVGFYQGTDAKGRVLVLGGNTGDKVGTQAIDRKDVLGFRRAPSAADSYKEGQKAADDAAREFQRSLDQVIAKYLPATAAAKEYADELARIDALAKGYDGKNATSGLTAEQATAARAALKDARDKKLAEISLTPEAKAAAEAKKNIDGVVQSLTQELSARQALDPVQKAMAQHQDELAKLSDAERVAYEAKLRSLYAQDDAYKAVEDATKAAADAQRQFRDMALDAFDAIVIGGEKAGDVVHRLAQTIASAAIEAAVLGTGPLAALLKGGAPMTTTLPTGGAATAVTGQAAADLVGKSVGKSVADKLDGVLGKGGAGKLLQNAGFGFTAASITGGNGVTGALGGALGGQIAGKLLSSTLGSFAGPLGSIAGGILGGVVGKMFGSVKKGSATLSNVDGSAEVTGSSGNSAYKKASVGMAGAIGDQLDAIVGQFNAELGNFSVSIGQRKKKFVVDAAGTGKTKGSGTASYDTAEEAQAAALVNALADGAVKGVSPAVAQALRSSTDVNKAVAEAMKVQNLELTMGGVTATIEKAFRDFETTAKERVRIASQYGFDLVAIEKKNGEDRAKLASDLAAQQVGSLSKLIEEMTTGSLSEGTALDRITALNTAIDKAKKDVAGGVEGSGDVLADLYQKRLTASKEAYGTTSGYAADRTATLDEARAAVAAANARIVAAQNKPATDPALATTNAALDENNEQNARLLAAMNANNTLLAGLVNRVSGGSGTNLRMLAAY